MWIAGLGKVLRRMLCITEASSTWIVGNGGRSYYACAALLGGGCTHSQRQVWALGGRAFGWCSCEARAVDAGPTPWGVWTPVPSGRNRQTRFWQRPVEPKD